MGAPKIPKYDPPAPIPPMQQAPSTADDDQTKRAAAMARGLGMGGTILTSPLGTSGAAPRTGTSLLGV